MATATIVLTPAVAIVRRSNSGKGFGVGEVIALSCTIKPGGTTAAMLGGVTFVKQSGPSCTIAGAAPMAGTATLTLGVDPGALVLKMVDGNTHGTLGTVSITIIAPSDAHFIKQPGIRHAPGVAGVGFQAAITILPNGVSFQNVQVREGTFTASGQGYFRYLHGIVHPASVAWANVATTPAGRSSMIGLDNIDSGNCALPYSKGSFEWHIPWMYRLVGGAAERRIGFFVHKQSINAIGRVEIQKHDSPIVGANV